jgi:tRNA pseudouridine38-40 synthase
VTTHAHEPAGHPEQSGPGGLVRLRLDVSYDGAGFHGWARQPGLRSVQAELEDALGAVLHLAGGQVRVAVAGRTDAGVHATGQVCHADVPGPAWASALSARASRSAPADPAGAVRRRLNGVLPPDVRVRAVGPAPEGFDARWSASWRRYAYLVADDPAAQDPRTRGHVLWHPRRLDAAAMQQAARPFTGEHDFAAFCRARADASTVRTIHDLTWRRADRAAPADAVPDRPEPGDAGPGGAGPGGAGRPEPGSGPQVADAPLVLMLRADAFCHSMVRSLVGAFLAVGDGRWPVQRPAELLAAAVRDPSIAVAPAHGLTLVEVGYPADADLAGQAERARRWRGAGPGPLGEGPRGR